jgi:hypothetical protein
MWNKKLTLRQINLNRYRRELMEKRGISVVVNPNPKLRGKGNGTSENVSTKENE